MMGHPRLEEGQKKIGQEKQAARLESLGCTFVLTVMDECEEEISIFERMGSGTSKHWHERRRTMGE